MAEGTIFRIGGAFFIISGAMLLFFWLISIIPGALETSPIPNYNIIFKASGIEIIKNILIVLGSLMGCLGLIFAGLVFIKIPRVVEFVQRTDVEKKVNKLQIITWRILQQVKKKEESKE